MRTRLVVRDASAETAAQFGDTLEKDGRSARAGGGQVRPNRRHGGGYPDYRINWDTLLAGTAAFRGLVLGGKYDEAEAIVRQRAAVGTDVDAALQKDAALNAGFVTRLADTITAANRTGFWVVVPIGVASHSGWLAAGVYQHDTGT